MQTYTYIIIGASAAGISALNKLWQLDPTASVACITDQITQPYNTCFLADFANRSKTIQQLALRIAHQNVSFILGKKVIAINREKKLITLSDNSEILFQKLLLAMGTRAIIPTIIGIDAPGVFNFHTLSDVQKIVHWIQTKKVRKAMVIGAGLTGLECADVLHRQGIAVTIVEKNAQVLASLLPYAGATVIHDRLAQKGVRLFLHQLITAIEADDRGVRAVKLTNGALIETDLVICTMGVQPNSELAQTSGLAMQENYIAVNEYMQTSDSLIFAAGDVVRVYNQTTEYYIWSNAVHQGTIAAQAMAGNHQPYMSEISLINSRFFDFTFAQGTFYGNHTYQLYEQKKADEYLHVALDCDIPIYFQFIGEKTDLLMQVRHAMLARKQFQF